VHGRRATRGDGRRREAARVVVVLGRDRRRRRDRGERDRRELAQRHQRLELLDHARRERRVVDRDAHLQVPLVAPAGEVRRADQHPRTIDDDALRVEAAEGVAGTARAPVAQRRVRRSERPVAAHELVGRDREVRVELARPDRRDVERQRDLHAALDHRLVQRREDHLPVVEAVADDQHLGRRAAQELQHHARPLREERQRARLADHRHHQRAIEVLVEALARALGDVEAAVAGRAREVLLAVVALGRVVGAHGVARAQRGELPRAGEVMGDASPLIDEAPQRALAAGGAGREQDRGHRLLVAGGRAVDSLSDRARRIAAVERHRRHEHVRQRVEHVEANARVGRRAAIVAELERRRPALVAGLQRAVAGDHLGPRLPGRHRLLAEHHHQALAVDLGGGQPVGVPRDPGRLDAEVELTLEVGRGGLEAGEADERSHLAELAGQHHAIELGRQRLQLGPAREERHTVGRQLAALLVGLGHEAAVLGGAQEQARVGRARAHALERAEHGLVVVALEGGQRLCVELADERQRLARGGPEPLHERLEPVAQRIVGIGDRQRAHHLRKPAVARGADHEQLSLVALRLLRVGPQPRALGLARGHGLLLLGLRQPPPPLAAGAAHHHLGEVTAAALGELEPRLRAHAAPLVHEHHPGKVAQVPAPAGGHEAHRRGAAPTSLITVAADAGVPVGLGLVVELILAHERVAALAHEPARELERLDAHRGGRVARVAGRGCPERRVDRELHAIVVGPLRAERGGHASAQAWLGDPHAAPMPHGPEIEAADQHRIVDEVDHRPGPEGGDDLALSDLALRPLVAALALAACHGYRPPRIIERSTHTCTAPSTSRMDVGAMNLRSCSVTPSRASSSVRKSALPSLASS
jgi:hypothetical protein